MDKKVIGARILMLRNDMGLTSDMLANRLGVERDDVISWENGDFLPDIEQCAKLSKLFEMPIDELVKESVDEQETVSTDDTAEADDIKPRKDKKQKEQVRSVRTTVVDLKDPKVVEHRYKTTKTAKWSILVGTIFQVAVMTLLAVIFSLLVIRSILKGEGELMPIIITCVVIGLLAVNYTLYKTGLRYRIFLRGTPTKNYPTSGAKWFGSLITKSFAWLGKFLMGIKIFYSENKRMTKEYRELNILMVQMHLMDPPKTKAEKKAEKDEKKRAKQEEKDKKAGVKVDVGDPAPIVVEEKTPDDNVIEVGGEDTVQPIDDGKSE